MRDDQPGWIAKQIHKIDKLDYPAPLPPARDDAVADEGIYDVNDVRLYSKPKYYVTNTTTGYNLWPYTFRALAPGYVRIFTHLAVRNQSQGTLGRYYTYLYAATADAVPSNTITGSAAANRPVELLQGTKLLQFENESLGLQDLGWQAGQTVDFYHKYYEVKYD